MAFALNSISFSLSRARYLRHKSHRFNSRKHYDRVEHLKSAYFSEFQLPFEITLAFSQVGYTENTERPRV